MIYARRKQKSILKKKVNERIQISQLVLHFTSVSHFRFIIYRSLNHSFTPLSPPPSLPLDYISTLFKSKFQGGSFFISRNPGYSFAAAALMGSTLEDRMSMLKSFGIIYALVCYLINKNLSQCIQITGHTYSARLADLPGGPECETNPSTSFTQIHRAKFFGI